MLIKTDYFVLFTGFRNFVQQLFLSFKLKIDLSFELF